VVGSVNRWCTRGLVGCQITTSSQQVYKSH
jgi:hypothetical protein